MEIQKSQYKNEGVSQIGNGCLKLWPHGGAISQ